IHILRLRESTEVLNRTTRDHLGEKRCKPSMRSEVTTSAVPTSRGAFKSPWKQSSASHRLLRDCLSTFMRPATCYPHSTATTTEPPKNIPTTFDIATTPAGGVGSSSTPPTPPTWG